MATNENANVNVNINGEQAEEQLTVLQKETIKWRKEIIKANKAGDIKGLKKAEQELKNVTKQTQQLKKQMFDVDKVLKNLSGASLNDINKTVGQLNRKLKDGSVKRNSKEWKELTGNLRRAKEEQKKIRTEINGTTKATSRWKNMAQGILPALGFAYIVSQGSKMLTMFKDLAIQMEGENRRAATVFGDSLGYVEEQAEQLAEQMGLTNHEFVAAATNIGDLLIPLGFTREKSAELSVQLQGLAGALDEWTAGTIGATEVSNILAKAVLGENEQLKRLGIAIRQDSKEYIELVKLKKQDKNVTDAQARALATVELIYQKSTDAQTAYLAEGNRLLRFQKSITVSFSNLKESIAGGFNNALKSATEELRDHKKEIKSLENNVIPLISEYENLQTKTSLSSDEQNRMKILIQDIAKAVPTAVTEFDEYGKALGISTEAAKLFIEQQQAMLLVKNADAINEQEDALKRVNTQMGVLETKIQRGWLSDTGDWIKYSNEEIAKFASQLDQLGTKKLGIEGLLKTLRGEPLFKEEDVDVTEEVVENIKSLKEELTGLKDARESINVKDETALRQNMQMIEQLESLISKYQNLGKAIKESKESQTFGDVTGDTGITPMETLDIDELAILDEKLTAMEEREDEYVSTVASKHKWLTEEKLIAIENYATATMQLTDTIMMFNQAAMNREIKAAGGNLEKQDAIRRKYAEKQQTMASIQAVIQGALGIVKTGANLGYPQAIPFQVVQGLQTIAQIALIESQQFATGRYPVIGASDGQMYFPQQTISNPGTGIVKGPALISELQDEMIIDGPTTRNLAFNYPGILNGIKAMSGGFAPQFADGRYPASTKEIRTETFTDPALIELLSRVAEKLAAPSRAILVANEDYIDTHKEVISKHDNLLNDVSG